MKNLFETTLSQIFGGDPTLLNSGQFLDWTKSSYGSSVILSSDNFDAWQNSLPQTSRSGHMFKMSPSLLVIIADDESSDVLKVEFLGEFASNYSIGHILFSNAFCLALCAGVSYGVCTLGKNCLT